MSRTISRSQKRLKVNRDAYPGVIPRSHIFHRLARCSSRACPACQFPARGDAANDTDLYPTRAELASYLFPPVTFSRYCPPLQLARANCGQQPGPIRVLPAAVVSSLLRWNQCRLSVAVASRRVSCRLVLSRLVSSPLVSSRLHLSASSSSRGCHRQELSTRVKIITLNEGTGTDCGSSLAAFHPLDGHCEKRMDERTDGLISSTAIKIYPPRALLRAESYREMLTASFSLCILKLRVYSIA